MIRSCLRKRAPGRAELAGLCDLGKWNQKSGGDAGSLVHSYKKNAIRFCGSVIIAAHDEFTFDSLSAFFYVIWPGCCVHHEPSMLIYPFRVDNPRFSHVNIYPIFLRIILLIVFPLNSNYYWISCFLNYVSLRKIITVIKTMVWGVIRTIRKSILKSLIEHGSRSFSEQTKK